MPNDLKPFLWLLKLGALANVWFLVSALRIPADDAEASLVASGSILFAVSAWRCVFPNRYEGNVVLHDDVMSSAFVTRVLATFSEIAYVYFFAYALSMMNAGQAVWIDAVALGMVVAAGVSQCFVWTAILTGRYRLYVYEEIGWFLLFAGHTAGCVWLLAQGPAHDAVGTLLWIGVVFGAGYLPWQLFHLRFLVRNANEQDAGGGSALAEADIGHRLRAALFERTRSTASEDWGGMIGVTWMACYWVFVIPVWMHVILQTIGFH